jgi:8-oxo-dGTP diphosphatase
MEPDKCSEWKWFEKDNFPDNVFLPIKNLLKEKKL